MDSLVEVQGGLRVEAGKQAMKTSMEQVFGCKVEECRGYTAQSDSIKVEGFARPDTLQQSVGDMIAKTTEFVKAAKEEYGLPASHMKPQEFITGSKQPTQLDFDKQIDKLERAGAVVRGESSDTNVLMEVTGTLADAHNDEVKANRTSDLKGKEPNMFHYLFGLGYDMQRDVDMINKKYNAREQQTKNVMMQINEKSAEWAKK